MTARRWQFLLASVATTWIGFMLSRAEEQLDEATATIAALEEQLAAARTVRGLDTEPADPIEGTG